MSVKPTEWSDQKKWVMGIASALIVTAVVGVIGDQPNDTSGARIVRILDSDSRGEAVAQLRTALRPLEKLDGITLVTTLVPEDKVIANDFADATVLVAHLHTYRPTGGAWDPKAQSKLFDLIGQVAALNPETQFLVYSRTFPDRSEKALTEASNRGQLPNSLRGRIHTIAFPMSKGISNPELTEWMSKLRTLAGSRVQQP